MKKILVALFILVAFTVAMLPITSAYASPQTVNCSWWSDSRNYDDYYEEPEEEEKPATDDEY